MASDTAAQYFIIFFKSQTQAAMKCLKVPVFLGYLKNNQQIIVLIEYIIIHIFSEVKFQLISKFNNMLLSENFSHHPLIMYFSQY